MGANEKSAATWHPNTEYTPGTSQIRDLYELGAFYSDVSVEGGIDVPETMRMFDRWLANYTAEKQAEALEEARANLIDNQMGQYGIVLPDMDEAVVLLSERAANIRSAVSE